MTTKDYENELLMLKRQLEEKNETIQLCLTAIREGLTLARSLNATIQGLERRLSGVPAPKVGE